MDVNARQKRFPLASVVMASYNARPWISDTVKSILSQDYSPLELVIVDDASTDGTLSLLNSIKDRRVRVYRNKKNLGLSATCNRGLKLARGEYINFFDDDDLMLPGAVRKRAKFLSGHKESQIVFGYTQQIIGKDGRVLKRYERKGVFPSQRHFEEYKRSLRFLRLFKTIDFNIMRRFFLPPLSSLNNLLVRKSLIERVGLFRPDLKVMNDSDYMFRLIQASPFHFIDVPVKHYRFHGGNTTCCSSEGLISRERRMLRNKGYDEENH